MSCWMFPFIQCELRFQQVSAGFAYTHLAHIGINHAHCYFKWLSLTNTCDPIGGVDVALTLIFSENYWDMLYVPHLSPTADPPTQSISFIHVLTCILVPRHQKPICILLVLLIEKHWMLQFLSFWVIDNDVGRSSYGAYQVKQSFEYAYIVLHRGPYTRSRGER